MLKTPVRSFHFAGLASGAYLSETSPVSDQLSIEVDIGERVVVRLIGFVAESAEYCSYDLINDFPEDHLSDAFLLGTVDLGEVSGESEAFFDLAGSYRGGYK